MLKRLALVVLIALAAPLGCDEDTPRKPPGKQGQTVQYAAIYFEHNGRLVPEYHALSSGEPERVLWDLLTSGPDNEQLTTAIGSETELLQAAEPDEGRLLLEIDEHFWQQDPGQIFRASAQIVFTMGNLEEGGAITLIDELRPGRIERPGGDSVEQPLTKDHFAVPLIQVVQPVAGATVTRSIPVDLSLAFDKPVAVSLEVGDETVASTVVHRGRGQLVANKAPGGAATVVIEPGDQLAIEVPVTLAPRS